MANKVIGVEKSEGEFTDPRTGKNVAYNNIKIHFIKPNPGKYSDGNFGSGMLPVTVKINKINKPLVRLPEGTETVSNLKSKMKRKSSKLFSADPLQKMIFFLWSTRNTNFSLMKRDKLNALPLLCPRQ